MTSEHNEPRRTTEKRYGLAITDESGNLVKRFRGMEFAGSGVVVTTKSTPQGDVALVTIAGGVQAAGAQMILQWSDGNLAQGQSAEHPTAGGKGTIEDVQWREGTDHAFRAPTTGKIVAIFFLEDGGDGRTAGEATFEAYIDAVATGLIAKADATTPNQGYASGSVSFVAGELISVRISSDESWSPSSADFNIGLILDFGGGADNVHDEDHDHDGDPTQKLIEANTHESVSTDTHHAQGHSLASHSSEAHSELTGVGATDHHSNANDHVEAHSLASHSSEAHSELSGVGVDDHHAQSHSLASHSSEAHSELTGVGVDDHHAQGHSLASHSSEAHSELSGVGSDDHHAQSHSLASHSSEAHSELSDAPTDAHHNEVHIANLHSDIDTVTSAPTLNEVLKWNGSNWVPGLAGDTTEFTFSIDSFSDGISDGNQLIGSGEWKAIGAISFTATYSNAPGGMTAEVALSGAGNSWAGNEVMTPVTGAETNDEEVDYPASPGNTITFTLSQSADASTDTETVTFNNTMRYGSNANGQGAQTETNLQDLTEVPGPNEGRSQTINNIVTPTGGHFLTFAYADRLGDVAQVQVNKDGQGYVTASFAAAATTLAPDIQTGITNVANSAGYSETFAAITSRLADLPDGSDDWKLLTSGLALNYLYWGELAKASSYTEADVEDNIATQPGRVASNSMSSRSMTVNATGSEHTYIAYPARLGALTSIIIGGFESIGDFIVDNTALAVTNHAGYQENYRVYVSINPGFTDPTTMTVTI